MHATNHIQRRSLQAEMTTLYLITISILQLYLLWNCLRVIDTTSELITVGMKLKKNQKVDVLINSIWIICYFLIPIVTTINSNEDEINYLGLFLTSLLFGKFFWDTILPSFGPQKNSLKNTIWLLIWGPIANLITGVLVVKLISYLLDSLINFILTESIINSINFGLNFLSDIWFLPAQRIEEYQFSIGLVILVFFILQIRIFPLYLIGWKKLLLNIGIFALILRTIKYLGGDFENILNIGSGYFKDSYSIIAIITMILGWLIALLIEKIKKPAENIV